MPSRQHTRVIDEILMDRVERVASLLGYGDRAGYLISEDLADRQISHVIRQAIDKIGVHGVLFLEDGFNPPSQKPIVYLTSASNSVEVAAIRKDVWSQGVVPFVLVVTADTVEICNGFEPPSSKLKSITCEMLDRLPPGLENFTGKSLSSSVTWKDFEFHRGSSIDSTLVASIETLNRRARSDYPAFEGDRDLINALIGKFIYIYVLIDRAILTPSSLSRRLTAKMRASGQEFIDAIFEDEVHKHPQTWKASAAFAVFAIVDQAINGTVFDLSKEQQARVPDGLCQLIHRVIRGGELLTSGASQPNFFDVSFDILRTETISAIYERFVSIEDVERKKNDGVFYTPPHLADHVLDRLEAVSPITPESRMIDPAAGSGIFLVGAYRRIMEAYPPEGGWSPAGIDLAKKHLLDVVHGIEKHPQAVNVCRFSLYLTLLDYVGRASMDELVEAAGSHKFLPDLSANIVCADAFDMPFEAWSFTHVVGNPPWSMAGGQKDRANRGLAAGVASPSVRAFADQLKRQKIAFGHDRLCDLFTWLALRRLATEGAAIAFVINARSVIGRQSNKFSHCLATNATVRWAGNLSHLRRKLFAGADASTVVLVALNRRPVATDDVAVYRPLLTSLPADSKNGVWSLLASQTDIQIQRSQDLQRGANGWFTQIMLGPFDRRLREALSTWATTEERTFGHFIRRSGLRLSKGGSPAETNINRTKNEKVKPLTRAELARVTPKYRGLFAGNVILIPRSSERATYYHNPVAYPSTRNGLIPIGQFRAGLAGFGVADPIPPSDPALIEGMLAYLNSTVVEFFSSLFGATYLMDGARFEKNDLLSLPCPFEGPYDPAFLELAKQGEADERILDAMKVGHDFKVAFAEFSNFRRHFANAQTPLDSHSVASPDTKSSYLMRLEQEIQSSFDRNRRIRAVNRHEADGRAYVVVTLGTDDGRDVDVHSFENGFLGSSIVDFDPEREISVIVKSLGRNAWTIDQAVADAVTLHRRIHGAGAQA